VVGFDLDMTLYDTAPSIEATLRASAKELGIEFDVERFMRELGPPLDDLVAEQLDPGPATDFIDKYREIYHVHGLPAARLMPGARDSLRAVRDHGGRSIVITGKNDRDAGRHVAHDELDVAKVIGWAWGPGKTKALKDNGAGVYVGDHPADVAAARAADAAAVAVTTGSHGPESFGDADAVLASLREFPGWLERWRADRG
jgi:phosphoglycolate phosphatase